MLLGNNHSLFGITYRSYSLLLTACSRGKLAAFGSVMIDNRMQMAKGVVIRENLGLELYSFWRVNVLEHERKVRLLAEYSNRSRKHLWPGNRMTVQCAPYQRNEYTKRVQVGSERTKFRIVVHSNVETGRALYGRPRGSRVGEFIYTAYINVGAYTFPPIEPSACVGRHLVAATVETIHLTRLYTFCFCGRSTQKLPSTNFQS